MSEQRPGVEQLAAVNLLPLVGGAVSSVALRRQRVRRRSQAEDVKQKPLVVAFVGVREEVRLGLPAVGERRTSISRPIPVSPTVERVRQTTDLGLVAGIVVEIAGA